MKYSKKRETLFLEPSLEYKNILQETNIVLSPSLYWVKKISLPLKSVRDVKKLLPSIFEDILPDGNYSYSAYKKEGYFLVFAYEDRRILEIIAQKNISVANIAKICFAQIFFEEIDLPLRISKEQALVMQDGVIVIVPSLWHPEAKELHIDDRVFPKETIVLEKFNHIVDKKNIYKVSSLLFFIAMLLGAELLIVDQNRDDILLAKEELFSKHNLKPTMMQNESLAKKYNLIHQQQMKLRSIIGTILTLGIKIDKKIASIAYKEKSFQIAFDGITESEFRPVAEALKEKSMEYKVDFKESKAFLEILL